MLQSDPTLSRPCGWGVLQAVSQQLEVPLTSGSVLFRQRVGDDLLDSQPIERIYHAARGSPTPLPIIGHLESRFGGNASCWFFE